MKYMDAGMIAAVLEAYDPEGVAIWFTNWLVSDDLRVLRMEAGVLSAWSGSFPKPQDQSKDEK